MGAPRIDEIGCEPVVGRFYLVPTVRYRWHTRYDDWPVFLPRHEDGEHLDFHWWHYHIDPRFVSERNWRWADGLYGVAGAFQAAFQAAPLQQRRDEDDSAVPHPPVIWRRRLCRRDMPDYVFGSAEIIKRLRSTFAGEQCRKGARGWVCPHKGADLSSVVPDDAGVITCPMHGLRVCAATGKVLPD